MRAAYEESLILAQRKQIHKVCNNPDTPKNVRTKLKLILAAKKFAPKLKLKNKNSYDYYTHSSKEALTWVLMASPKTSFAFKTWWFPIVGNVPYKGFFSLKSAKELAKTLEKDDYETSIRGADAFSTLGWFNDPVVTPFLKRSEVEIVDTVLHELVHASYWVKNHVAFNESLANFVGTQGAIEFFKFKKTSHPNYEKFYELSKIHQEKQFALSVALTNLFDKLNNVYKSKDTREVKLLKRAVIFKLEKKTNPILNIFKELNNSELLQLKIYLQDLVNFHKLYKKHNRQWIGFWSDINLIIKQSEIHSNIDPFKLLRDKI